MRLIPPVRLAILAAAIGLSACDLGTTNGDGGAATVSLSLPFSFAGPTLAAQRIDVGGEVDQFNVSIVVKGTGESVLQRTFTEDDPALEGDGDSDLVVELSFRIPTGGETETFTLTINASRNGAAQYEVGPIDFQLNSDGRTAAVEVPARFVGPGNAVTGVLLAPRNLTLIVNQTLPFSCVGTPGNVADFPHQLETANDAVAIAENATTIRGVAPGTTQLVCRLAFGSRSEDRIPVTVTAGPTITVVSGGGQTGAANTTLANPILVQVKNSDGSNATGVTVSFTPNAGHGTANPTSAATNQSGQASTSWTLGTTTGAVNLRASATVQGLPISVDIAATVSGAQTGSITGIVQSNTAAPISGATVELRTGTNNTTGTPQATSSTGSNGSFTFGALTPGAYTVRATATGFQANTVNVTVVGGPVQQVTLVLTPATGTGTISGSLQNSVSGAPIANATVVIRAGTNVTTGATAGSTTSSGTGGFVLNNVVPGAYTIQVTATGFATEARNVTVAANTTTQAAISMNPLTGVPAVRIRVEWGAGPPDLDAYLFLPNQPNTPINFANRGNCAIACLQNDDVDGGGPETVDIVQQQAGDYFFHVHNYSAVCDGITNPPLSASAATVRVEFNGVLVQTLTVPAGTGTHWRVFRLNGTTITPVQTLATDAPPGFTCSSGGPGGASLKVRGGAK